MDHLHRAPVLRLLEQEPCSLETASTPDPEVAREVRSLAALDSIVVGSRLDFPLDDYGRLSDVR